MVDGRSSDSFASGRGHFLLVFVIPLSLSIMKPWLPPTLLRKFQEVSLVFDDQKTAHLQASILESPAYVPLDKHGTADALHWSKNRDILIEVGLSVQTLVKLGMISGQILEIQNLSCGISHVARVVALGFDKETDNQAGGAKVQNEDRVGFPLRGVAYFSPTLVQALKLNCALAPFLLPKESGSSPRTPPERVILKPVRKSSSGGIVCSDLQTHLLPMGKM